jgi:hypothetical protein
MEFSVGEDSPTNGKFPNLIPQLREPDEKAASTLHWTGSP